MGDLIEVDFSKDDCDCGYITDGEVAIKGVYVSDLCANALDDEVAVIGEKINNTIRGLSMPIDDLNTFCIMWLGIFDPESLSTHEEEVN